MATMTASRNKRRQDPGPPNYRYKVAPLVIGSERFRIKALAAGRLAEIGLNEMATSIDWSNVSADLSGSLGLTVEPERLQLDQGREVQCEWADGVGAPFRRLWTMKIDAPQVQEAQSAWTVTTNTTLTDANKSTEDFAFRKDHHHPHGWTADQITRYVAGRVHMPIGKLAVCTHRILNLIQKGAGPLDVITKAYRQERVATGRLFFMYWDGALNIVPLTRSERLLMFAGSIIDAQYQRQLRPDVATTLTVRATAPTPKTAAGKKGRKQKKIVVQVTAAGAVKQYGYIHRTVDAPSARTATAARKYGANLLTKLVKPTQTLTVTVPIRPDLQRGDAFNVNWKAVGLTQTCYVASLVHHADPQTATTEITAQFTDPFVDQIKQANAGRRAARAAARKRKAAQKKAPTGGTGSQAQRRA